MNPFLRVTLPLAAINFLNQAARTVVATVGPLLAVEFGLSAAELGFLAAAFFAAYGLTQLPVGLALDLYGPRRVQTGLVLLAAVGFAVCAAAATPLGLGVGRFLSGVGVAAGLMAILKANTQWYPRDRVAGATGTAVFVGSFGSLLATVPVQWALPAIGWRGAFWGLAALSVAIGGWVWASVPEAPPGAAPPARRRLGLEIAELGRIVAHPAFRRLAPAASLLTALNFTYQGLWAGPWLRDVAGLAAAPRAQVLFCYAAGLIAGSLGTGQAASWTTRRGANPMLVPWLCMGGLAAAQLVLLLQPRDTVVVAATWFAFSFCAAAGPASYAAIGARFAKDLAGRVMTAINFAMLVTVFVLQNLIGVILDLWPRAPGGGWAPEGYAWALAVTLAMQAAAVAWMIGGSRGQR